MGDKNVFNRLKTELKDRIGLYETIIAESIAGDDIIEPDEKLGATEIEIGYSTVYSDSTITKYFYIGKFPDYIQHKLVEQLRKVAVLDGVRLDFYMMCRPYTIDWASDEMKSRTAIWKKYTAEHSKDGTVFDYRDKRDSNLARDRIIKSLMYLNYSELNHKRTNVNVRFIIKMQAERENMGSINLGEAIKELKKYCRTHDIELREMKINMIDWVRSISLFSLSAQKELSTKFGSKVLTDDIIANCLGLKQGRVGETGICMGHDIKTMAPIMRLFHSNPDDAENVIVSAETGGGKSYLVKPLIPYFIAAKHVVTVNDYEGDEYTNIAAYIKAANADDVCVISMGKGSTNYADPCVIPSLTGDDDVDNELKSSAVDSIKAHFKIMVAGTGKSLTTEQESVISTGIERMYDYVGVTEDKYTWENSSKSNLKHVYLEIKDLVISKELQKQEGGAKLHEAATTIAEACKIYFEDGGSKSGTFKKPISLDKIFRAKFIVFSFGMKGAGQENVDKSILALKQLSVANLSNQISNHCKYVKHCFNVKIWEEYQRYGADEGSADIISNAMTGGRKRGDLNILITNDLKSMLDDESKLNTKVMDNIQHYIIGKIPDEHTRKRFCEKFKLMDCLPELDEIAKASKKKATVAKKNVGKTVARGSGSRYTNAFLFAFNDGQKAVGKVFLPEELMSSQLFKTGVQISE